MSIAPLASHPFLRFSARSGERTSPSTSRFRPMALLRPAVALRPVRLRLTRRGRFVLFGLPVLAVAACLLGAGLLMLTSGTAQAGSESHPGGTQSVTVAPGDTLWDIAQAAAPEEDPRSTMAQIEELNQLDGSVRPGQHLVVPQGAGSEL